MKALGWYGTMLCVSLVVAVASHKRAPTLVELRETSVRLEFADGVCSGGAVAADKIVTAQHCLTAPLQTVNGTAVAVVETKPLGEDVVELTLAGVKFKHWVSRGTAQQGDRVRFVGQPKGEADVYGEGYVAKVVPEGLIVQSAICKGMSGALLWNDRGEWVGVVSAMTDPYGCTYLLARV